MTPTNNNNRMPLFIILLVVLLIFVFAFASGKLNIGISGSFTYLIYIFLGLISSVVCYGMLSSMGEINGHRYSTTIKLGGAIVGLVVVGGGGLVYEKYVHKNSEEIRLVFYTDATTHLQTISGEADLLVGNQQMSIRLDNQNSVLFQGLQNVDEGSTLNFSLDCPDWKIDSGQTLKLTSAGPIYVKLTRKATYAAADQAKVTFDFNNGTAINYVGRPNDKNIVIQIQATSQDALVIPIDKSADLQVISDSGTVMATTTLTTDEITFLPPNASRELSFDGFIPINQYEMVKGKTAILKLHYKNMSGGTSDKVWQIEFDFKLQQ